MARNRRSEHSEREIEIDKEVGRRVASRRKQLGISQGNLGKAVGVAFQQIRKYEGGENRISASRLVLLSRILRVPTAWFLDGLGYENGLAGADGGMALPPQFLGRKTVELIRAFYSIASEDVQQQLISLTKAIADGESKGGLGPNIGDRRPG